MPGADAAEDHLAEHDVGQRHQAAERRERVVPAVDRAAAGVGRHRGEERGVGDAEADFLAFHVAAGLHRADALIGAGRVSSGLPRASAQYAVVTPARNRNAIAAQTAQPCVGEPVIWPSV